MCEINPKHSAFFRLEAFTSVDMTEEEFQRGVMAKLLAAEVQLNRDGAYRFHIHEEEAEAPTGETNVVRELKETDRFTP